MYYPFGLKHKGYNNNQVGRDHKFEFLGQEFQDELGLNWHSYKWRNADPALGRFFGVDPISEDYVYQTTYQFASNNPIWKIEIEGLEGKKTNSGTDLQDDTKFSSGWNSTVGNYNSNFQTSVNQFMNNPIEEGMNMISEMISGAGRLVNDLVPGVSEMTGIENTTLPAVHQTLDKIENIPNMTNEELGEFTAESTKALGTLLVTKKTPAPKGLGNPFRNSTLDEVVESFENRVKAGTMERAGPNPAQGRGAYINKKSGYSYHLDKGGNYGRKGKVVEGPHVDVNYPNPKPNNVPSKKKLDVKEKE